MRAGTVRALLKAISPKPHARNQSHMQPPAASRLRCSRRPTEHQAVRHPKPHKHGRQIAKTERHPALFRGGAGAGGGHAFGGPSTDKAQKKRHHQTAPSQKKRHPGGQHGCTPPAPAPPRSLFPRCVSSSSCGRSCVLFRPRAKPKRTSPTKSRPHTPPG